MNVNVILTVLKSTLVEKYPDFKIDFYVSRRSHYVHMGLDQALHSIIEMKWKVFGLLESIMISLFLFILNLFILLGWNMIIW